MASTVTLAEMRLATRERADQVNSEFISDSELNRYINKSARKLWDLLIDAHANYKFSSTTISLDGTNSTYNLPSDFYKILMIDYTSGGQRQTIDKMSFFERTYGTTPISGISINLEYAPTFTDLALDGDTMDGLNGWEEFVEIDAALKCFNKEETDPGTLLLEKSEIVDRIQRMRPRDFANPDRTRDVRRGGAYKTDALKYRIVGDQIQILSVGNYEALF